MPEETETIDYCQACQAPMDVSAFAPFSNVECPACGEHSRVKINFGPYTLTRRHAIGGMSMVFVAHDPTLDREVIVKILSEEYSKDEARIRAFEEEAKITASFNHPNVVRVLRTGKAFDPFYIAMELVEGDHFEHHIRENGRISEIELLPLAIEVAQGLKAAQAAGLIHRDVKPGNILLDSEGHAKLVDFGLALVTQEGSATATELWATPFYVPPETVEGKAEDFRSDIYALGSTLYHALAGTPPCNEPSMSTTLLLKAKQHIVPLHKAAPEVSEKTCQIIDRAMAYQPEDRFSSYDELIRLFGNALKQARHHPEITARARPPRRSNRNLLIVVSILIALVATAATVALWPDPEAKTKPSPKHKIPDQKRSITNNGFNNSQGIVKGYQSARQQLKERNYEQAVEQFTLLFTNPNVKEPSRTWAGVESVIGQYLQGNTRMARQQARAVLEHLELKTQEIPTVGKDLPTILSQLEALPAISYTQTRDSGARELLAAMLAGLKNWEQGLLDDAAACFKRAIACKLPAEEQWAAIYQQIASDYLADHHLLTGPLFQGYPPTSEGCQATVDELNLELIQLKTRGRARFNIRAWQLDLARHANALKDTPTPSTSEKKESPGQ